MAAAAATRRVTTRPASQRPNGGMERWGRSNTEKFKPCLGAEHFKGREGHKASDRNEKPFDGASPRRPTGITSEAPTGTTAPDPRPT
ncbi:hypothetical protein GEV33_011717 [Tenebrio molitor]|uniref:Uncharacterized protein n=1 Tax=Tenebrio molitor TaxID=7067 RepID=A0A8J6L9K9_TENMO|nr:hypothetical protein GEV33_011717 [Tenebrio molitor]